MIEDRDMPGHDYRHVEILDGNHVKGDPVRRASIETCFKVCASDVKCLAWTIDTDNLCWLKDGLGKSKTRKGVATGVLWSRKRCGVDEMVVPSSHHWNKLVPKLLPHYKDA